MDQNQSVSDSFLDEYYHLRTSFDKKKMWRKRIQNYVQPTNSRVFREAIDKTCIEKVFYKIIGQKYKKKRRGYGITRTIDQKKIKMKRYWHTIQKNDLSSLIKWEKEAVDPRNGFKLKIDMVYFKIGYVEELKEVLVKFGIDIWNVNDKNNPIRYSCYF